ncbi:hypothetical protein [Nibricoccus aquaticus]|uniref:hypothetical protein n=1 Tax=Nibricoccus aquaticus TaxID=2576891 RepID=UPI0010FE2E2C|nr:hypothetical protein [Nibricoccus aquaticus]
MLDDVGGWLRDDGVNIANRVDFASVCALKADRAGIFQHFEAIGAAVDQLVSQLHTNKRGLPEHPATNLILGSWRLGESVRKVASTERRSTKKKYWIRSFAKSPTFNHADLSTPHSRFLQRYLAPRFHHSKRPVVTRAR